MPARDKSGHNFNLRFKKRDSLEGIAIRHKLEEFCKQEEVIGQKGDPSIGNLLEEIALALEYDEELATAAMRLVLHLAKTNLPVGQREPILAMLKTIKTEFDIT